MKILILSKICDEAISHLGKNHSIKCAYDLKYGQLINIIAAYDVVVFRSGVVLDEKTLTAAKALKLLVRAGSGMDNLDVKYAERNSIQVKRIQEPAARAVAEMCLGLMLCLARKIIPADQAFRRGHWAKQEIEGRLLAGKVLGIVGVGSIGSFVGQLGNALGMRTVGCVEFPSPERCELMRRKGIELKPLADVVKVADFLSIHVPLKASTHGFIDGTILSQMKGGAYLINLSRGGVVDEQALFHSLIGPGRLAGAALDVHQVEGTNLSSPFSTLDNVILTPHIGSQTIDTQREIGERVVEIVNDFVRGKLHDSSFCSQGVF